jgi:hypothetical protein
MVAAVQYQTGRPLRVARLDPSRKRLVFDDAHFIVGEGFRHFETAKMIVRWLRYYYSKYIHVYASTRRARTRVRIRRNEESFDEIPASGQDCRRKLRQTGQEGDRRLF